MKHDLEKNMLANCEGGCHGMSPIILNLETRKQQTYRSIIAPVWNMLRVIGWLGYGAYKLAVEALVAIGGAFKELGHDFKMLMKGG